MLNRVSPAKETLVCETETETKTCKTLHGKKLPYNQDFETFHKDCRDFEIG